MAILSVTFMEKGERVVLAIFIRLFISLEEDNSSEVSFSIYDIALNSAVQKIRNMAEIALYTLNCSQLNTSRHRSGTYTI